jgi:SAM-dependent methyltransferase
MNPAAAANREFYDALWSSSYIVPPQRFNTWPLLSALAATTTARLEIGPGLHPRLPIAGTCFIDVSEPALASLRSRGGRAVVGDITALPFPNDAFDLIGAFDIVEHVEDDQQVFRELARVAKRDAAVVLSVPLHSAHWTSFDDLVGHLRRYDLDQLLATLEAHSFSLEQSAAFGMEPRNRWALDFTVWALTRRRVKAMRWYNKFFLPLGLLLQRRLTWVPGLIAVDKVDELLLVCRRGETSSRHRTTASVARTVPLASGCEANGPATGQREAP